MAPTATPSTSSATEVASAETPLARFIFRHYALGALIPILSIELLLLVIYFAVNSYTRQQTVATLRSEVTAVMPHLVRKQADLISTDFRNVQRETAFFAQAHADLFTRPADYHVAGDPPRFAVAPTGALYQTNRDSLSSLFFVGADRLTADQKEKARLTAALDPLYRHMVRDNPHVAAAYLNTPDNMNRLYPFIPEVYKQYPANLRMVEYNFYYLADASHNPERKPVWTGVYLDPAGQGWMLSCVAPVYQADTLVGVVGLDVTTTNIAESVLAQRLPWGANGFLADGSGMVLAMGERTEEILGLRELKRHVYDSAIAKEQLKPEEFNLLKNRDAAIAAVFRSIYDDSATVKEFATARGNSLFVVQQPVDVTGWKLFVLIEADEVLRSVNEVSTLSQRIGYGLIGVMLVFYLFFFLLLRRRARSMTQAIADPAASLARAARALGSGARQVDLPNSGLAELDDLTRTFTQMADELDERSRALVETEVRAKMHEKEAELAYARGMFEAAGGYLHNVGNSITRLDSSLLDLDSIVRSTEQYPVVFDRLAAASDPDMLARFRAVLVDRTVPRLRDSTAEIRRIKDIIQQTIRHQQQSFRDAREAMIPEAFDLVALVREAAAGISLPPGGPTLSLNLPERAEITHHRSQLYNGVVNVIKNGVEACEGHADGHVRIDVEPLPEGARVTVTDNGCGVQNEHRERVMSAGFTTKPQGNGFGLHSFAVFLSANRGRVTLSSPGPGQGATATIEVQNA